MCSTQRQIQIMGNSKKGFIVNKIWLSFSKSVPEQTKENSENSLNNPSCS